MNWYRQTVIRILLLVAGLCEEDEKVRAEIKHLSNHINVHAPTKVDVQIEVPSAAATKH